ncbi:hypothetical protein V6N11_070347 [Hibiscus sabdariffa]|uniref:MATH domain-containing protein n=1 Tax=Hibiscus sabdariffa TaxID=183260 RepID=A0ABR2QEP9_9ROSI
MEGINKGYIASTLNSKTGSNLTKDMWRIEILNAVGDSNGEVTKVTWRIQDFSSFKNGHTVWRCSEDFSVDGNRWRINIHPKGNKVDHLKIFITVADSATLPSRWTRFAQYGFAVIDQIDRRNSIIKVYQDEFNADANLGYPWFLALSKLQDPKRGYLVDDACLTKETDCDKLAIDNQTTAITEPVGIPTPSPTQPSCQIEAVEPEPTEEDIKTLFTSLESVLSSSHTVFSKEEAKEALAKLDEALNMTPADFYHSGKFSSLEKAFKILVSFDCSSTTLTIKQKNELLAMGECLKELADRAAEAVENKGRLTEKESIKRKITRKLDHNLIRYKEVEQKLAALSAERKGIFRSSKEMKMELEAVEKEWAGYEANAKAAEEEERSVEAEWGRMKDFISSIKGKI